MSRRDAQQLAEPHVLLPRAFECPGGRLSAMIADLLLDLRGGEQVSRAVEDRCRAAAAGGCAIDVGRRRADVLGPVSTCRYHRRKATIPNSTKASDAEHADAARQLRRQRRAALERRLDHGRESGLSPPVV